VQKRLKKMNTFLSRLQDEINAVSLDNAVSPQFLEEDFCAKCMTQVAKINDQTKRVILLGISYAESANDEKLSALDRQKSAKKTELLGSLVWSEIHYANPKLSEIEEELILGPDWGIYTKDRSKCTSSGLAFLLFGLGEKETAQNSVH
jgi:hypothetical protein